MAYEPRTYRTLHRKEDLYHFRVVVEETDLDIAVNKESYNKDVHQAVLAAVQKERQLLKSYIKRDPVFLTTLAPHPPLPGAPPQVMEMWDASSLAGVGPMAAVAGLVAERVGQLLTGFSREVIVENGGDIWLKSCRTRRVAIFAGASPFSYRLGLEIDPAQTPLGICTSSGTIGHSLSFGCADAVVILAHSATLSDAVATAAGNMVKSAADLEKAVGFALSIPGVSGAVAILGDKLAAQGQIKLVPIE
ncbi:MAG: UPF0280 family protein [Bacillota bacterium]